MDLNSGSAVHKLDHWAMMIFNQIVDTKLQTILQSIQLNQHFVTWSHKKYKPWCSFSPENFRVVLCLYRWRNFLDQPNYESTRIGIQWIFFKPLYTLRNNGKFTFFKNMQNIWGLPIQISFVYYFTEESNVNSLIWSTWF